MFVKTTAGRVMPIDAEPHPAGSVRVDWRGIQATAHIMSTEEIYLYPGRRYISHMATCPVVDAYRRHHGH